MGASSDSVRYLIFDVESVARPALVSAIRTRGTTPPAQALREYRDELLEQRGSDFVPYVYHTPVSLALAKVGADYSLQELSVLRIEDGGAKKLCERFWGGWRYYNFPQFVTFNGRGFDLPLMELTAFRYGIPIPEWFADDVPSYKQPRNRYASSHFDLYDFLTNYGASSFVGGLNLASKLLHKPGKIDAKGDMVQDMFDEGNLVDVHRYCRCDVLDTYFVFLRVSVLRGKLDGERERELIEQTRQFLLDRVGQEPVYQAYLNAWDDVEKFFCEKDEIELRFGQ